MTMSHDTATKRLSRVKQTNSDETIKPTINDLGLYVAAAVGFEASGTSSYNVHYGQTMLSGHVLNGKPYENYLATWAASENGILRNCICSVFEKLPLALFTLVSF